MSRSAKTAVMILVLLAAMLLVTLLVPEVRAFASRLASTSGLPIWLVGLAAPILFALQKLGGLLGGVFGDSATERDIRARNEAIRTRLDAVERDVRRLDEWRQSAIGEERRRIAGFEDEIAARQARVRTLEASIGAMIAERDRLQREIDEGGSDFARPL